MPLQAAAGLMCLNVLLGHHPPNLRLEWPHNHSSSPYWAFFDSGKIAQKFKSARGKKRAAFYYHAAPVYYRGAPSWLSPSFYLLLPFFSLLFTPSISSIIAPLARPLLIVGIDCCISCRSCRHLAPWESVPRTCIARACGKTSDSLLTIIHATLTKEAGHLCEVPTNIIVQYQKVQLK